MMQMSLFEHLKIVTPSETTPDRRPPRRKLELAPNKRQSASHVRHHAA